jgi:hypothetical protein
MPASESQLHALCRRIARKYGLFECDDCAADIVKRLGRESDASVVRIRPSDGTDVIGLAATGDRISENYSHVGVQVQGLIFDNLHPDGVPAAEWQGKFITQTDDTFISKARLASSFFGKIFRQRAFRVWIDED